MTEATTMRMRHDRFPHVTMAAVSMVVALSLSPSPSFSQACDDVVLADGSCAAAPPPFEPEHANAFAFEGGSTGTSADAGININGANLRDGGKFDIPTGGLPSPLFGAQPFEQRMLRFEEFGTEPLPASFSGSPFPPPLDAQSGPNGAALDAYLAQDIHPEPTRFANEIDLNPWQPQIEAFLGRALDDPPAEGRPPGPDWAHQRWTDFFPAEYFQTAQAGSRVNGGLRDSRQLHGYSVGEFGPGGLYHNTIGPSAVFPQFDGKTVGIPIRFHPDMPIQDPLALWTFDGTLPPKLLMARYGRPILMRHYNALPIDPSANLGFGLHTITTHEHNGHQPAESDGYTQAFYFPGQFYDYRWPLAIAGHDSINTSASDPRAGTPDGSGGIINIPGDPREVMSTHWFHDHMLDFTAQNVYKGNAAMMNYYSSVDRGREPTSLAEANGDPTNSGYGCHYANSGNVNLCFPSGSNLDWGNRDYDVQLLIADKAWDADGQLFFNIFNLDGFLGDHLLTNWLYKPYFEVRARRYRFRILNGSVSRYFRLAIVTEDNERVPFHMIANDGNIMEHAVYFPNGVLPTQAIAERYDIIIDFSQFAPGTRLYMVNLLEHRDGQRPHEAISLQEVLSGAYQAVSTADGWEDGDPAVGKFLEFRVMPYGGVDLSMDPAEYVAGGKKMIRLPTFTQAELDNARRRFFEFGRSSGTDQAPWTIKTDGGSGFPMDPRRLSAAPAVGSVEVWHIENGGGGWSHPIHIHFEEGRILRRDGKAPPEWERWARKDVYRVGRMPDSGDSVEVALRFREFLGSYMEHCHNTQHEDHAMLLRWDIENPGQVVVMPTPMPTWDGVTYVDSHALPTFRTGDLEAAGGSVCGDDVRNQPGEQCDGPDAAACPGQCQVDCTCPIPGVCGDDLVNQVPEECDGADDAACPGQCEVDCVCATLPVCGDGLVNHADEECDGADAAGCPGACMASCACGTKLFDDDFSAGLALWTESGEGDWNTELLHSSNGYAAGASGAPAAHSDNCDSQCTITTASAIDLSSASSARLMFLRFVDQRLDASEFLRIDTWDGSGWVTLDSYDGGEGASAGQDDDTWHEESYDLGAFLGLAEFRIRFVTRESGSREHVHVDDVMVLARTVASGATTPPPTTTTTTPPPSTTTTTTAPPPPTITTTTLPSGADKLFNDDFSGGLEHWTETGEGDWNTEALHETDGYPGSASGSPAAHSDNCDSECTITMSGSVDLSGRSAATLTLLRFLDASMESSDFLRLDAWNGSGWTALDEWRGGGADDDDTWHQESYDLAPYLGQVDFRIRLVTRQSSRSEHVHVDDVTITATGGGGTTTTTAPPTTTTSPPVTTTTTPSAPTTTVPAQIVAEILADVHTKENDENDNFGNATFLSVDRRSEKNTFMRIRVSGLTGPPSSAVVRLTVRDRSGSGSDGSGGRVQRISDCTWNENTITFANQPPLDGTPGPAQGPVEREQIVDFDITTFIDGNGTFCLGFTSDSSDATAYNSTEASENQPELIVIQ